MGFIIHYNPWNNKIICHHKMLCNLQLDDSRIYKQCCVQMHSRHELLGSFHWSQHWIQLFWSEHRSQRLSSTSPTLCTRWIKQLDHKSTSDRFRREHFTYCHLRRKKKALYCEKIALDATISFPVVRIVELRCADKFIPSFRRLMRMAKKEIARKWIHLIVKKFTLMLSINNRTRLSIRSNVIYITI